MERKDAGLAFLLQYENVAWYEKGRVRILDRRIYPQKITYVECSSWQEVRQAIADMVTQSAGPYTAAAMGMALAAYQVRDEGAEKQRYFLKEAAQGLAHARPTTANRMGQITMGSLVVAQPALRYNGKGWKLSCSAFPARRRHSYPVFWGNHCRDDAKSSPRA